MTNEEAFEVAQKFFAETAVVAQALRLLKPHCEISVILNQHQSCALFFSESQVIFAARPAKAADVEFGISAETLRRLADFPTDSMGLLGVEVLREIVAGHVNVHVPGSIFNILSNGYLNIIKEAGPEFLGFLTQYGISGLSKIVSIIKGLKR